MHRDGVVYYIYWMDGDDLRKVQAAWVLMPNRLYQKYDNNHDTKWWHDSLSIGKIIGQCFEDDIVDCTQEKWQSNFYHLTVNGEECAKITWEDANTAWDLWIQILIAILAACALVL